MNLDSGGGIVNYYFVHLLKLLVDLNYDSLEMKFFFEENYCRLFSDRFDLKLNLTEDNLQNFKVSWIKDRESREFKFMTPFGPQNTQGTWDVRVEYLSEYLLLKSNPELEYATETRISKLLFRLLA
jgi:hypothetical protein